MNRIQSKNSRIGTYQINNISLSCFYDKIYILNKGYYGLAVGYQSYKNIVLILYLVRTVFFNFLFQFI